MGSFRALCIAGIASLAAISTASAADLFLPPPPPVEPAYVPVEFSGGFYLRGDVGVAFNQLRGSHSTFNDTQGVYTASGGLPPGFEYNGASVNDQAVMGAGFGYQFNNYFRADITGEYRFDTNFHSRESYYNGGTPCTSGAFQCADVYNGSLSSSVFLANGYVDLGTWYGLTPFAGVGVGVAFNHVNGTTDVGIDNRGAAGYAGAATKAQFAWALMAGVSYAIAPRVKLEVGYRYLNMGGYQTGGFQCNATCVSETQHFRLSSSEVRVGLRYMFADYAPAPAIYPLVRKY
jgi:opacity protein-like surface antigen